MKRKLLWSGCGVFIAAALAFSNGLHASEPTKSASDAAKDAVKKATDAAKDAAKSAKDAVNQHLGGGADAAMMEAMQRWEAHSTPGEHHKHMESWAGEWDLVLKHRMVPDAPWEESKSTSSAKMIMGGRYLVEKVKGAFDMGDGGPPAEFEGMALMGYDNSKKQYFSIWIDNFGTGVMEEWGTCDGTGKVLTTTGRVYDPMIGSERDTKSVATLVDSNTRRLEMYMPGPDGRMFVNMEITYTRKK